MFSDGLQCAFNDAGTLFAVLTDDGRLRSYDTVTGRLRSNVSGSSNVTLANGLDIDLAKGQQAGPQLCIRWLDCQTTSKGRAGPSKRPWLAAGTVTGGIKAFDTATGKLVWQSDPSTDGGVSCLAYSAASSSTLYASGADGVVRVLDAATGAEQARFKGSKHAVSAAALAPDGSKLLVGGSALRVWALPSQQRLAKLSGHPLPARAAAFAPDGDHAVSAGAGERGVAVWDTRGGRAAAAGGGARKKAKGDGVALARLPLQEEAVALTTCAAGEGGSFLVAAVTEAGEAHVWRCGRQDSGELAVQAIARVHVGGEEPRRGGGASDAPGGGDGVLAAHLEAGGAKGAVLLVARGSSAKPVFERVHIAADATHAATIALRPAAGGALLPSAAGGDDADADAADAALSGVKAVAAAKGAAAAPVRVLGPDNDGVPVRLRGSAAADGAAPAAAGRKRGAAEASGADAAAAPGGEGQEEEEGGEEEEEEEEEGPTLGERVAALEAQQRGAGAASADADGGAAPGPGSAAAAAAMAAPGPLTADSLAVLLGQALRSGDNALLERCLSVANERVVSNTVARLVAMDAAALLRAAVERLASRPARGPLLVAWVRAALVHHAAYLMAAPGVQPVLTALYQTIEARLAHQRALLSLAGRLDLLLAQRPTGAAAAGRGGADADDDGRAAPLVTYQESDSEAEVEDAFAPDAGDDSGADDSGDWEDEGEEGGGLPVGASDDADDDEGGGGSDAMDEDDDDGGGGGGE